MTLVDHAQASELFSAYWEKELKGDQLQSLEEHLGACVVCRREYQRFQRTVGALGALHKMVAPPELSEQVRTRIRKRSRGRFFSPRRMAERIPYELFSLVMLGLILAIYLVLSMAQPGIKLP